MQIAYGGDQLRILRVEDVDMRPVMDPSGADYLYSAITLTVSFVWHPYATATNTQPPNGNALDPLGYSVRFLRERLNTPRQVLRISVGGNLVWSVPDFDANNRDAQGNQKRLPCDVGGGPFPRLLGLTGVEGDYGAMGLWRVTFHKRTGDQAVLLSNRWTTRVVTNEAGMSTRLITGYAQMRADLVNYFALAGGQAVSYRNIDDLRNWLFCPVPAGFIRGPVDVLVTERGDKARYIVTDTEDPNPMGNVLQKGGAEIQAAFFDGGATTGSAAKIKSWNDVASAIGHIQWWNPATWASVPLQSVITDNMATAWAQVWGGKNVPKSRLLDRALQICLDRMNTGGLAGVGGWFSSVVGVTVTQGMGKSERQGRWVRVEIAWRPLLSLQFGNNVNIGNVRGQVNYANDVQPVNLPAAGLGAPDPACAAFPGDVPNIVPGAAQDPKYFNTNMQQGGRLQKDAAGNPIKDGGSRGTWMGALLVQALQAPFDPNNRAATPGPAAAPPAEEPFAVVNQIP